MAGKPTDVIEDWTYGPVRWIGSGLVIGAAAVGIAWSISSRRVPVQSPTAGPTQIKTPAAWAEQLPAPVAKPVSVQAPKPIVTEVPPREQPANVVAITEAPRSADSAAVAGPINVNLATVEQLEALPGIGPGLAAKIVDDRSRNGRFRTLADLDRVPGIGPKLLEKMKPLVAFD